MRVDGILSFGKWAVHALSGRRSPRKYEKLLELYLKADESSDAVLLEELDALSRSSSADWDVLFLIRLKSMVRFRQLLGCRPLQGKLAIQQIMVCARQRDLKWDEMVFDPARISLQTIAESAVATAELYWKIYDTAHTEKSRLQQLAEKLLIDALGKPYEQGQHRAQVEKMTDSLQRDGGLPFLMLNLIRHQQWHLVRPLGARLLTDDLDVEEDLKAVLYWVSEISWFTLDKKVVLDHESTIRNLYHLCFTNPERAGFLEIDSQFFSQFETVNEIAREGLLFKEELIESMLNLWHSYDGLFDKEFQQILQSMTGRKNKIYDTVKDWTHFWEKEFETFGRDYLYLVEGNLSFAQSDFEAAHEYFGKALEINPALRPALLNRLFSGARMGDRKLHEQAVDAVLKSEELYPGSLSVVGNSHMLLGEEDRADSYYERLKQEAGWQMKTDYYRSTFCYEHGLFEGALRYAKAAHKKNPQDASVAYQLSLCFSALGEKEQALTLVKQVAEPTPGWLHYYRFQLERDSGLDRDAQATLANIPVEYFDDPEELEEAMEFAKSKQNLTLLRTLRSRAKR